MVEHRAKRGERAQLVLIAAILVATTIVGAVVLLNTVHSSPDVKAQTDAQSLVDTERTVEEIQQDLQALFFATNATNERKTPFANESELRESAESYSAQRSNFTAREGVAVQSVNLTSQSVNGSSVFSEKIENQPSSDYYLSGAESLPYLAVTLTDDERATLNISGLSGSNELTFDSNHIRDGSGNAVCSFGYDSSPVTVELIQRSGEIRAQGGKFCEFTVSEFDQYTVRTTTSGPDVSGSVAVSGGGGSITTGSFTSREPATIVNPVFEVSYTDPSVTYNANVTLFGGDE